MDIRIGDFPAAWRHGAMVLLCLVAVPSVLLSATSASRWLVAAGGQAQGGASALAASVLPAMPSGEPARYLSGSAQRVVFDALIERRASTPQERLDQRAALDEAAHAHLAYLIVHGGDGSAEQPGAPGFTGSDAAARARAAGYHGVVTELVIAGSGRDCAAAVGTARMAGAVQQPRWRDVGVAAAEGLCVVVLGHPALTSVAHR